MSNRALSSVLAERAVRVSPLKGCRGGSIATLWQTSVSSVAVMSRIALCQIVENPSKWHVIAWPTVKCVPHLQVWGMLLSCQPYLRHSAACLWILLYGDKSHVLQEARLITQEEAPFSLANSTQHFSSRVTWFCTLLACWMCLKRLSLLIYTLLDTQCGFRVDCMVCFKDIPSWPHFSLTIASGFRNKVI